MYINLRAVSFFFSQVTSHETKLKDLTVSIFTFNKIIKNLTLTFACVFTGLFPMMHFSVSIQKWLLPAEWHLKNKLQHVLLYAFEIVFITCSGVCERLELWKLFNLISAFVIDTSALITSFKGEQIQHITLIREHLVCSVFLFRIKY